MRTSLIITALVAFAAGYCAGGRGHVARPKAPGVITVHDTVTVERPAEIRRTVTHTVVEQMRDTVGDTVAVYVPVERVVYAGEGYRAWVSGHRPALDSISFVNTTVTRPARRWSVGIQAGVGVTPAGPQPYIGVGISYRLL